MKAMMALLLGVLLALGVAGAALAARPGIPCELDYQMHASQ